MSIKKRLLLLPVISFCFLGVSNKTIKAIKNFTTSFSLIGPFTAGCNDYRLSGRVTPNYAFIDMRERLRVYVIDGAIIKTENKDRHTPIKRAAYNLSFTLPFKSALTSKGLRCVVDFLDYDDTLLQSFTFDIRPISPQRINPRNYVNEYFSMPDIIVDPDYYKASDTEKYKFDNFLDYFDVDNYYRLSLKKNLITYSCGLNPPQGLAHLHFVDYLRIFPYLDSNEEVPTFDIPLYVKSDGNGSVYFDFPSKMYVNPKTLDMSLTARVGFVETKYFYLPVNKCEPLQDQVFTIVAESFGHGQTSFTWDVRYLNSRHLLGDCSNSDYCVVGEVI